MVAETLPYLEEEVACGVCGKSRLDGHTCLSPTQWDFVQSEKRFVAFTSGRGCGKTFSALCKLGGKVNDPAYRGSRWLVWGPTYNQLKGGTLVSFDDAFYKWGMIKDKKDGNEPERWLLNDIHVLFRNASNPDQTRGHEYAVNWLDEAGQMDEQVFRLTNAATRQRRPDGSFYRRQMLITTTPRGKNWLYRYFKDQASPKYLGEQCDHFETTTIEAMKYGIVDPTYIDQSGYVEGTMEYEQEILGRYVSWGGAVFYAFDERRHYDRTYAPPAFDRVYGGIDVGLSSPTAIELTGLTSGNKFVTFKEFYQRNAPPHVWMPQVKVWQDEFKVDAFYVDNAFESEIKTLRMMGVNARPSMKAKDAAGTAVGFINGLFQQDRMILMAVPNLRREIEGYEVKEKMSGDEMTFLDKVKPDQQDHAIDAWRYHIHPLSEASRILHRPRGWSKIAFGG